MNVGDRVRLLTGTEEGIVTRLLDSELVEVAIDNDFTIPVLRRELVLVSAEESQAFRRPAPDAPRPGAGGTKKAKPSGGQLKAPPQNPAPSVTGPSNQPPAPNTQKPGTRHQAPGTKDPAPKPVAKGLYLALVHQAPELLSLHLLNYSDQQLGYTFGEERQGQYRALAAGQLAAQAVSAPLSHLHLKDFDQWPAAVFQLLGFKLNAATAFDLLTKRQAFRASTFYTSRRPAPVLGKDAYLFQLDERPAPALTLEKLAAAEAPVIVEAEIVAPINLAGPAKTSGAAPALAPTQAAALQAALSGDKPAPRLPTAETQKPTIALVAPPHELDLHLEALRPDGSKDEELSNAAILRLQLDTFEDALSRALATNMHEIIFIHGAGAGVLRKEIHRQLSRNKDIKFFEDARKERFGYGATLVRLK